MSPNTFHCGRLDAVCRSLKLIMEKYTWHFEDGKTVTYTWNEVVYRIREGIPLFMSFENHKVMGYSPKLNNQ